jgi:hypothetical protein
MAKPSASDNPRLKAAWDEYGHSVRWEDLIDMKMDRGCYVVLAWRVGPNWIEVADLARSHRSADWEMQNDGSIPLTDKQWNKLRIVPNCDWYKVPEEVGAAD